MWTLKPTGLAPDRDNAPDVPGVGAGVAFVKGVRGPEPLSGVNLVDGSVLWSSEAVQSPSLIDGAGVYSAGYGRTTAIDEQTGATLWTVAGVDAAALDRTSGVIACRSGNGFVGLAAGSGTQCWQWMDDDPALAGLNIDGRSLRVVSCGGVFLVSAAWVEQAPDRGGRREHRVTAVDARTGLPLWRRTPSAAQSVAVAEGCPVLVDREVLHPGSGQPLWCLPDDGQEPKLVAAGILVTPSGLVVDAWTGSVRWSSAGAFGWSWTTAGTAFIACWKTPGKYEGRLQVNVYDTVTGRLRDHLLLPPGMGDYKFAWSCNDQYVVALDERSWHLCAFRFLP